MLIQSFINARCGCRAVERRWADGPRQQQQQQRHCRARPTRLHAATSPPFFERQGSATAPGSSLDTGGSSALAAAGAVGHERVGVLLLNLGGPDSLDDVQPFLYNLFADPDIIRLPASVQFLQPAIAQAISTLRAPKSREGYEAIGGGSPLRRITEEQAAALSTSLRQKGVDAQTYVAMRYWFPFTGWSEPQGGRGGSGGGGWGAPGCLGLLAGSACKRELAR